MNEEPLAVFFTDEELKAVRDLIAFQRDYYAWLRDEGWNAPAAIHPDTMTRLEIKLSLAEQLGLESHSRR